MPDPNTYRRPTPTPPPSTPHDGAWTLDPTTHDWHWTPHATPDPALVKDWGTAALTDIRQDPTGHRNIGAWVKYNHQDHWTWVWGAQPDPNLASTFGKAALTDPDHTPSGSPTTANDPPPPDVKAPTLTDAWQGVPPDVTGNVPATPIDDTHANGQTATEPPPHRAFVVSPGSIRNAESVIAAEVHTQVAAYDSLKSYVEMSHRQNLYSHDNRPDDLNAGLGRAQIITPQNHLLLAVGDVITLAGQVNQMLNMAAQNYAKADRDSFMPGG